MHDELQASRKFDTVSRGPTCRLRLVLERRPCIDIPTVQSRPEDTTSGASASDQQNPRRASPIVLEMKVKRLKLQALTFLAIVACRWHLHAA